MFVKELSILWIGRYRLFILHHVRKLVPSFLLVFSFLLIHLVRLSACYSTMSQNVAYTKLFSFFK